MAASGRIRGTLGYMIIVIMTFVALQSVVIVMHEFTHSTVAWLLGCMPSPLGIVWGNPLTMRLRKCSNNYGKSLPELRQRLSVGIVKRIDETFCRFCLMN
jgi:hypothetical protein